WLDGDNPPTLPQEIVNLLRTEERDSLMDVDANADVNLTHTNSSNLLLMTAPKVVHLALSTPEFGATQHRVDRPLWRQFAAHHQPLADTALARLPVGLFRQQCRQRIQGPALITLDAPQGDVRSELAILAAIAAQIEQRLFQGVVQRHCLLRPRADANP